MGYHKTSYGVLGLSSYGSLIFDVEFRDMNSAKVKRYPYLLDWTYFSPKLLCARLEFNGRISDSIIREWKLPKSKALGSGNDSESHIGAR